MSELAKYQNGGLVSTFDEAARAAKAMAQSGYFNDAREVAQAMVKILAGHEMGFGPFASMNGINVIKGKPAIGANLMAAAVRRNPRYDYRVIELNDKRCELAFYDHGEEIGRSDFTIEEAKRAGVGSLKPPGKPGTMLEMHARNMLFSRAMSNGVRWYAPDAFAGSAVYTPDELDSPEIIDEDPPPQQVGRDPEAVEGEIIEDNSFDPEADAASVQEIAEQDRAEAGAQAERASLLAEAKHGGRPWRPEVLRAVIQDKINEKREAGWAYPDDETRESKRTAVRLNLGRMLDGNGDARHDVSDYLTGKQSSKDWDTAEIDVLRRWIKMQQGDDGNWYPSENATREAHAVATQALKDAGQSELPW